jgi:Methyltransferase FkbM domain
LDSSELLFSPGSDRLADFENYLAKNYGIKSVIIDTQDKKPRNLEPEVKFDPGWIQAWTDQKGTSLNDWINAHSSTSSNLILQMDIEGSEYSVLQSLPTDTLARFKILIIEFHFLEQIKDFHSRELLLRPAIEKLCELFDVVHTHANNCCGEVDFGAFKFPRVIEVTFHRRDRRLMNPIPKNTPHELDFPNLPGFSTPEISWTCIENVNRQNGSKF